MNNKEYESVEEVMQEWGVLYIWLALNTVTAPPRLIIEETHGEIK